MKRMDRYAEEDSQDRVTRASKNQELYQNIGKNTRYTNVADITNINVLDLSQVDSDKTRENYQKIRQYSNLIPGPKVKRELEEFKNIYKIKENRVYDINSVLAEARKTRKENDNLEEKRKLKNDEYNILVSLSKEELEEYRKKRKEKYLYADEEEIRELIDTITSKTLAGEIDKNTSVNLLSELMTTSILDKMELKEAEKNSKKEMDTFFTSSDLDMIPTEENQELIEKIKKVAKNKKEEEQKEEQNKEQEIEIENEEKEEENENEKGKKKKQEKEELEIEPITDKDDEAKIEKEEQEELNEITESIDTDTNFYTINMGRPTKEEEMDDEFAEKTLPLPLKLLFFLIFVGIIACVVYFIWKM